MNQHSRRTNERRPEVASAHQPHRCCPTTSPLQCGEFRVTCSDRACSASYELRSLSGGCRSDACPILTANTLVALWFGVVECLELLGSVAAEAGQFDREATIFATTEEQRARLA